MWNDDFITILHTGKVNEINRVAVVIVAKIKYKIYRVAVVR